MKDQSVTNDFLHYFINKNDIEKLPLNLDNVASLLPHIKSQLNSKYDSYQISALKSAKIVLNGISQVKTDFNLYIYIENSFFKNWSC